MINISKAISAMIAKGKRFFKSGFLDVLTGSVLVKAIAFISGIVIVRLVDKNEYAYYTYAVTLYSYIGLLSGMGLGVALLKFCSKKNDTDKDKAYVIFATKWGSLAELILSVGLCIFVTFFDIPFPEARKYVYSLILMPFVSYLLTIEQNYHRAHLKTRSYAIASVLQSSIVCVLGAVLAYFIGVKGMIAARYVAVVVAAIYAYKYYKNTTSGAAKYRLDKEEKKKYMSMAVSLMIANAFSSIMPINEAYLISQLIRDETVTAEFKVAGMIPQQLIVIASSVMIYYFPIISDMTDFAKIKKLTIRIGFITGVIIGIITGVGMIFTPLIIRIVYGEKYMSAVDISYALWIMRALNSGFRMVPMNLLPATGYTKYNAISSIVFCIIHTAADYWLISEKGIEGVAYATSGVYIISGIITWAYFIHICNKEIKKSQKLQEAAE